MLFSLADIAKDTISTKNPFHALPGLPSGRYGCKWGLTDLYPEDETILREAISSRKTFDTGWIECKKEIRSFRMISDGNVITIQASAEMDDFEDLIYDAMESDDKLTEEQMDELNHYWDLSLLDEEPMDTSTSSTITVPLTTYENAMKILAKLETANESQLNKWFEIVKGWVKEVTEK